MTQNTVSAIASTPWTGLATQTYNVTTSGLYTFSVQAFLPWMTSDQPFAVANPPAAELQTITTVADVAGSLNSTFWTFHDSGNLNGYYVWYNINSAGVDPAPAGLTGIQVAGATGASANTLAAATRTAIAAAVPTVTVSGSTNHVVLLNNAIGSCTAAADGTAATSFTFAVNTTGTYGYSTGLVLTLKRTTSGPTTTTLATLSNPAPTQALMGTSVRVQCVAGDTLTMISSSLASVDQGPNAVKGFINIYLGT